MYVHSISIDFWLLFFFFFQAEDGIRDLTVTGVQTCALPISAVRDLQQAFALHLVERTVQNDLALDGIERPVLGLTVGAVVRMDLLVAQADLEVSEGPALVLRVHSQRDRGARAQRGEQ